METEKTVQNLISLLTINNNRIEGYKSALYEARETDLKMMFSTLAQTSLQCKKELASELKKHGIRSKSGFISTGIFFDYWPEMKKAIRKDDRISILERCGQSETAALELYQNVINKNSHKLDFEEQSLLNKQYELLKADYERLTQLHHSVMDEV